MLSVAVASRNPVRRLALARAVSFFGSTSAFVALASVVYARTGSASWVAAVALASFATPALASPWAGALADRHDRRAVMVCSDLLGALCFVAMALVGAPAALVGIKVVAALVAAPLVPASSAALPGLAPEGGLARANSTLAVGGTVGALAGPLAGGVLVALASGSLVFALNAVTFLVSALLLATLRFGGPSASEATPHPSATPQPRTPGAGFALLRRDPALRRLAIGVGLVSLGIGTTLPAELPLVDALGGGATGYGALVSAWGLGGLLGARVAGGLLGRWKEREALFVAFAGVAVAFLVGGLAPFLAVLLAALACGGAAEGIGEVTRQLMLQRHAPDEVRARVSRRRRGGSAGRPRRLPPLRRLRRRRPRTALGLRDRRRDLRLRRSRCNALVLSQGANALHRGP